jgi:hypothetical protein
MWCRSLPWLLIGAAIGLAAWLRFDWIQNAPVAQGCLAGEGGLGCVLRAGAVILFSGPWLATLAVAGAVATLLWRHAALATLAAMVGGIALVLYTAEIGAFTLLVGLLRLVRAQSVRAARSAPPAAD